MTNFTPEQAEDFIINWLITDADDAETESVKQKASRVRQIIRAFDLHKLFLEINSCVYTEETIFIIFASIRSLITFECINQYSHYLSFCLLYNSLLYSLDNILCLALCLEINCAFKHKLKVELDFIRSYRYALCLLQNLEFAYQYARGLRFEETILGLKEKLFSSEAISCWWIQRGPTWTEELISITIMVRDYYRFHEKQIIKYKQQLDLVALLSKQIRVLQL